jgi:molybdenum cofactor cytidylyltransferase
MSSSIRLAVKHTHADALLLLVCDQPHVTTATLRALMDARRTGGKVIVASAYADTLGVPALFDRSLFGELGELNGQQGAKAVIQRHREEVHGVPFADGAVDLDTPDDVRRLNC